MVRIKKTTVPSNLVSSIITFVIVVPFLMIALFTESDTPSSADGFTIDSYQVILNVNKKNVVDVTENITVNWYETNHHGIYKFTPEWLQYTDKNGKTIKRKSKISNLKAIGEEYSVDEVKKKKRIKIGSAAKYVDLGLHTYSINYQYDMGTDPFKNGDEFIFHAFGDYWGTIINNASIKINMPKNIEGNHINFFFDKFRKQNAKKYLDYNINGNTIDIKVKENYTLMESLTVDIELPEGYFEKGSNNYGYRSLIICLFIMLVAILSFIKWLKYGKDLEKVSQTVEFYPPENYDAAQIGYIYGKQSSKKLTVALIVQLAAKGYIKIEESEDKKTRTIINLLPVEYKESEQQKRTIKISKQKEPDESISTDEKKLMNYLFRNGNNKDIMSGFDDFYKNSDNLIKKGYIKIESDDKQVETHVEEVVDVNTLKPLTTTEQIVYNKLFDDGTKKETNLSTNLNFYTAFTRVASEVEENLKEKVYNKESYKKMATTFLWLVVCIILWFLSYFHFEDLNPAYSIFYLISFLSLFVILFFVIIMGRKTEYGELITARVLGFRNYLKTAEKPQLEAQVEKNPNYFYDILPYAYVLNVSKKWIAKFEDIKMPETNMGNFDYCDMSSFHAIGESIYFPSSSGSSSGCGGGCSSCGGGCSSCGGGGSW